MDRQWEVQITDDALADMEAIYWHIADVLQSSEYASGQYDRIANGIVTLAMFPECCPVVPFEPGHTEGLRRLLVDNYSVFYVCRDGRVVVTSVLRSTVDIEKRLGEEYGWT